MLSSFSDLFKRHDKPVPPIKTMTHCPCGHHLGLVEATPGIRCPECNKLLRPLIHPDPPNKGAWFFLIPALSPVMVMIWCIVVAANTSPAKAQLQVFDSYAIVFKLVLFLVSWPSAILLGVAIGRYGGIGTKIIFAVIALFISNMINGSVYGTTYLVIKNFAPVVGVMSHGN